MILTLPIMMASCSNGQNRSADGQIAENVNVERFEQEMKDAQILDVRTPQEWSSGVIEDAMLANIYGDSFESTLEELDKDRPVAVYCASGGRSGQAMEQMKKMGFKEVYNLKGGMGAWTSASKPTVTPEK